MEGSEEKDALQRPNTPHGGIQQSTSVSSVVSTGLEQLRFFSGNPAVEKTTGILHFYKNKSALEIMYEECYTVCMMEIPAHVTCSEFLRFIQPGADKILESKIVRDGSPNQYFVIIKFRTPSNAFSFYQEYNGLKFNSLETASCNMLFVERLEITTEKSESERNETSTEYPTCAVCLERMEGDGLLTILCNHTFHSDCLQQWEGSLCPVCRFHQTPELIPDQTCSVCGNTTDLWMCLICGNIGCGRYNGAHAYIHFEETSHTFTKSLGQELVWDYAGDNFVHRLIQGSIDGKMVELQGADVQKSEENEAIEIEVAQLFSSQMETQRLFFEGKIKEIKDKYFAMETSANNRIHELEENLASTSNEQEVLQKRLTTVEAEKANLEKRTLKLQQNLRKAQSELDEERQIAKIMSGDKQALVAKNVELEKLRVTEIRKLEEQVNDLMAHFDAQNKLSQQLARSNITADELQEGNIGLEKSHGSKKKQKRNK